MKQRIDKILEPVLITMLAIMLLSVLWQVFSRYLLKSPSSITEELARYMLIWVGTLGAAYAAGSKLHLAITLFPDKLSPEKRQKLQLVLNALVILFSVAVFCIGGSRLVYITNTLGQTSPALGVPLHFVYAIIPVSGVLIIWYNLIEVIEILTQKK
jgi:TRAP-type C4-dicarboxylate transport system permease small subunit